MTLSQDGAARLSTYDARHILQYGAPAGSGHYLAALATFLTAQLQRPPMLTLSRTMYVPGPRFGTHGAYARASLLTTVRTASARLPRLCRIYRVPWHHRCPHDPTTLFATTGNSGGLALVIRTLTTPGDAVLMEG